MLQVQNIFFLFLLFLHVNANSQSNTWQRLFNGIGNSSDNGRGICETSDKKILVTGFVQSDKAIVLKLNSLGDTIWTKYFDGVRGDFILPTKNGGCIITGQAPLVYTLRLDSNGNSIWFKSYTGSTNILPMDFRQTADGGFIICGYQGSQIPNASYFLKLDSLGNRVFQKYFYSTFTRNFLSASEKMNGNFILSGLKQSCEVCNSNPFIIELNNNGDSLLEKSYNLFADFKKIYSFQSGYIIGGSILDSPFINVNAFIMRTDFQGIIVFKKNIPYNNREDLKDLKIINNNRYIIACDNRYS